MRNTAFALVFVVACGGGGSNEKKDAADQSPDDGAPAHDAPALLECTPRNGTTISLRQIGQVSGSAVLATASKNDGRLFVLEQQGRIRIFENQVLNPTAYLDISSLVSGGSPPNEQGLLGLAFHPNFAINRQFYVFYTTSNANVVARYTQSATDPNKADPTGEVILSIPDFASNHNGGMIEFGPKDGYLYIGTGDGGGGGDPCRNSQAIDRTSNACQNPPRGQNLCPQSVSNCEPLLGKILRIDVNTTSGNKKYGIPSENPFANGGGEPEIYVIGLRNPWRWSFDRETGDMYIGDVGQGAQEEVTVLKADQQAGANLGWSKYEGNVCYSSNYQPCVDSEFNSNGMTGPQVVRVRNTGWISVIGGQVYRGTCFPDIRGQYIFADYGASNNAFVRATLDGNGALSATNIPHPNNWPGGRTSIYSDARGELFLTTTNGRVFQIEAGP